MGRNVMSNKCQEFLLFYGTYMLLLLLLLMLLIPLIHMQDFGEGARRNFAALLAKESTRLL